MTNVKALEIFSVQSLCDLGIFLSVLSFFLHLAHPYFDRIHKTMNFKILADLWRLTYIIFRDATLLAAFLLGLFHLNLDLMADIKVGLPFVPLATVLLAAALIIKVRWPDQGTPSRLAALFVGFGAALNFAGFILVMEGPGDEYAAASSPFWHALAAWKSDANPEMATTVFYLAAALLFALALLLLVLTLRRRGVPDSRNP